MMDFLALSLSEGYRAGSEGGANSPRRSLNVGLSLVPPVSVKHERATCESHSGLHINASDSRYVTR